MTNNQIETMVRKLVYCMVVVRTILYKRTIALGTSIDFLKGLRRSEPRILPGVVVLFLYLLIEEESRGTSDFAMRRG